MKAELINLIHRLNNHPTDRLQSLVIFPGGTSMAIYTNNALRFSSLAQHSGGRLKAELINLIHRLNNHPTDRLQSLVIFPGGTSMAIYTNNALRFSSLDDLERLAYPGEPEPPATPEAA